MEDAVTKTVDSKGRLVLGKRFANRTVLIREIDDTEIVITMAQVIPAREAWLFDNHEAKEQVSRGLDQARRRVFSDTPPDLDEDSSLADQLKDV